MLERSRATRTYGSSLSIFSRFEKLDLMFTAFIHFALITDMLCVNTP